MTPISFDGTDTIDAFLERFPEGRKAMCDLGVDLDDGSVSCREAITRAQLPIEHALAHLASVAHVPRNIVEDDWSSLDLDELVTHLEDNHHRFTRECLGRLNALVGVFKCGDDGDSPLLRESFLSFKLQLLHHLDEEERELFAQCRLLETEPAVWLASEVNLRQLTGASGRDHDQLLRALHNLGHLSEATVWPGSLMCYQLAFQESLDQLTADLALHTAIEYEYLIPGALHLAKLERSRMESKIQRRQSDPVEPR